MPSIIIKNIDDLSQNDVIFCPLKYLCIQYCVLYPFGEWIFLVFIRSATNKVYGCVVDMQDHIVKKDGGKFNMDEFREHPDRYASNFSRKVSYMRRHSNWYHQSISAWLVQVYSYHICEYMRT